MPASYAHYRFGRDVLTFLPESIRGEIKEYRSLYNIGLHGPDILFYYKPVKSNAVTKLGNDMHDQPALQFFENAADLYLKTDNKAALKAYLFGFICHFALDSTCHPYIEKMTDISRLSHTELESELERYFMEKDRIDPAGYVPVKHITASNYQAQVIAPCFSLSEKEIRQSLKGMIASHKLLHAPGKLKRSILYAGLKATGNYDYMQGLIMKPEANPNVSGYLTQLDQLYKEAISLATSLIQKYDSVLNSDEKEFPEEFHRTFGSGPDWEHLSID